MDSTNFEQVLLSLSILPREEKRFISKFHKLTCEFVDVVEFPVHDIDQKPEPSIGKLYAFEGKKLFDDAINNSSWNFGVKQERIASPWHTYLIGGNKRVTMQKQMPTSKDENKARMANGLQTRVIDIESRKKSTAKWVYYIHLCIARGQQINLDN